MAPPKARRPPAQPAGAGATGGWKVVRSKRTARQTQQPPKSSRGRFGGSGFAAAAVRGCGRRGRVGFHPAGGPEHAAP
eukprot:11527959-Alexandrium_andersonii.AAC.1